MNILNEPYDICFAESVHFNFLFIFLNTVNHLLPCHKNEHFQEKNIKMNLLKNYMKILHATGDSNFLVPISIIHCQLNMKVK